MTQGPKYRSPETRYRVLRQYMTLYTAIYGHIRVSGNLFLDDDRVDDRVLRTLYTLTQELRLPDPILPGTQ